MTTHPDALALLAAIIDDPADDLPRLAYADWCEERGEDARAEFIRVQCRIEPMLRNETPSRAERVELDRLLRLELRLAMENVSPGPAAVEPRYFRWAAPLLPEHVADTQFGTVGRLYGGLDGGRSKRGFYRGFINAVRCPLAAWLEHGPAVVRAHPVTRVEATDKRPSAYEGSDGPFFRWFDGSRADGPDSDAPDELPGWLWGSYAAVCGGRMKRYFGCDHAAEAEAFDALSDALLAWAKSPDRLEAAS